MPVVPFEKTLTFRNVNHKGAGLTLIFDDPTLDGLYINKFPVVSKVLKFKSTGPFDITVTFSNQELIWYKPGIHLGTITNAYYCTLVNYHHKTALQEDGSFNTSETDSVTVVNDTSDVQNAFLHGGQSPVPLYYWSLNASESIQTNFQPILRAYISRALPVGRIIQTAIPASAVFTWNLSLLDDNTIWDLKYDEHYPAETEHFQIAAAE
ncbi:hypothetical protein EV363DRAFT_1456625 [Boletus edulis]|nr:hypothetical protein EV363DRAFT_1456625 [Boletus edulis]